MPRALLTIKSLQCLCEYTLASMREKRYTYMKKKGISNPRCFREIVHFILDSQRKLALKVTHIQEFKTFLGYHPD